MRRHLASCAVVMTTAAASLGFAGAAFASGPAATTPAARSTAKLYLANAFFLGANAVTVPGRPVQVTGYVRPYVAGQWVAVKDSVGGRLIKRDRLRVKPSPSGATGQFTETVTSPRPGLVTVTAVHARTAQMLGFTAARRVAALSESVGFGSTGAMVALIQQRLNALHFYMPSSGVYDQQTGLAIDAYHRLLGHGVSQIADPGTIGELLAGTGAFQVRFPGDGTHVEGDLGDQLLAEINGSKVYRIYPISSGKPSTPTVLGRYSVYQRDPGYLPDGMYYSSFFTGGYAIHGYDPAPDYPASHGCMRLPISDAISVYDWLTMGDRVDVYL
jgi:peptidoglycan hydrolase-like protein with peptidoglycan-binding domain